MDPKQEQAIKLLQERGLRVTAQRRAVLHLFLAEPSLHLTAAEVLARIHEHAPEMSRATVYKALDDERKAGLLDEHTDPNGVRLYGLDLEEHDHFICERCGRWYDVPATGRPKPPDCRVNAGKVERVEVFYFGLCNACCASAGSVDRMLT
ncbi:MAG: Fur family transcriptional regulator [Bacillota bacterium]|nr:Fur family transcriptional regulator [Bacillota bacterium]